MILSNKRITKSADQTAPVRRLVSAFVVRKHRRQVFSRQSPTLVSHMRFFFFFFLFFFLRGGGGGGGGAGEDQMK